MVRSHKKKLTLSIDPSKAYSGPPDAAMQKFPEGLASLWSIGQWAWNLGQWKSIEEFEIAWNITEKVIEKCVETQSEAWFCKGLSEKMSREGSRDIDWLDDGFRRGIHRKVLEEFFAGVVPQGRKVTAEDLTEHELGAKLVKAITFDPSRLYWVNAVISVDRALRANQAGNLRLLLARSIEAAEGVRAGLGVLYASQAHAEFDEDMTIKDLAVFGAISKNAPMNEVRKFVQANYLNGTWKSKLQAAKALVPAAHLEASKQGVRLSSERAETTVYNWIRKLGVKK